MHFRNHGIQNQRFAHTHTSVTLFAAFFACSTNLWEEDNLSTRDKGLISNVSFVRRFTVQLFFTIGLTSTKHGLSDNADTHFLAANFKSGVGIYTGIVESFKYLLRACNRLPSTFGTWPTSTPGCLPGTTQYLFYLGNCQSIYCCISFLLLM